MEHDKSLFIIRTSPISPMSFEEQIQRNLTYWLKKLREADEIQFTQLNEERKGLFRAVEFGLRLPAAWPQTAELVRLFFDLVERNGYHREWLPLLQKVITDCTGHDRRLRGRLLNQLGVLQRNYDLQSAIASHQQALQVGEDLNNRVASGEAYFHLANDYLLRNQLLPALEYGQKAWQIFEQEAVEAKWRAVALAVLGEVATKQGEYQQAESYYQQAIELLRPGPHLTILTRTLINQANNYQLANQAEQALSIYEEARDLIATSQSVQDKISFYISLGSLYFALGRIEEAGAAFENCLEGDFYRFTPPLFQANLYNNLGNVRFKQQLLPQSKQYLEQAIAIYRQVGNEIYLANAVLTLADVMADLGEPEASRQLCQEAITLLEKYPLNDFARHLLAKNQGKVAIENEVPGRLGK